MSYAATTIYCVFSAVHGVVPVFRGLLESDNSFMALSALNSRSYRGYTISSVSL